MLPAPPPRPRGTFTLVVIAMTVFVLGRGREACLIRKCRGIHTEYAANLYRFNEMTAGLAADGDTDMIQALRDAWQWWPEAGTCPVSLDAGV